MEKAIPYKELCEADEHTAQVIERLRRLDRKPRNAHDPKKVCCICGATHYGYGNNPAPVKEEGRCCDACNWDYVIPARAGRTNAEAVK